MLSLLVQRVFVLGHKFPQLFGLIAILSDIVSDVVVVSGQLVSCGAEHFIDEYRRHCLAVWVEAVRINLLLV